MEKMNVINVGGFWTGFLVCAVVVFLCWLSDK